MSSFDLLFMNADSSSPTEMLIDEKPSASTPRLLKNEKTDDLDADIYEETDECDLRYAKNRVWLIKIPKFLQESWEDIPSDLEEQIELGTVLINKHDPSRRVVILSDDQIHNEGLPRGYYLKHPPTPRVDNTYLFTEKDTKKRKRDNRQVGLPEIPARFRYNKPRYDAATDIEGSEMDAPSFRKVRQNPTAVTGTVIEEMHMQPIQNAEYNEFVGKVQLAPKKRLKMDTPKDYVRANVLNPGTIGVVANKLFLKIASSDTTRVRKLDKAYRISKEELQTKLFEIFEKYEYYPTKFLVEYLCQPELYLKEVLEEIAIYNTHGEFHGNWCLKSEYRPPATKEGVSDTVGTS